MLNGLALDLILIAMLIGYLVYGAVNGFVRSLGGIAGVALGGVAAVIAVPLVQSAVPSPTWRLAATLAAVVLLVAGGHALGAAIGAAIRRSIRTGALRVLDGIAGAATTAVIAALVASLVASGVSVVGVPVLSQAIASSSVLRTIERLTPAPVAELLARARSLAVDEGLPTLLDALGGPLAPPAIPDVDVSSPALQQAAQSVVRITGTAIACGQNQTGSGAVIAPGRVVTNAHVVAGVSEPVVEAPGELPRAGRIVYFDPVDDLAVIAVDDLPTRALPLADGIDVGERAVFDGYPLGGPFSSRPAEVLDVRSQQVPDIYDSTRAPREVVTIAGRVEQGNSGGPLLDLDGAVAGVIFAKSTTADVGYAAALAEVAPVVAAAPGLDTAVAAGACTRG